MIRRAFQMCAALVVLVAGLVGVPVLLVRLGRLPFANASVGAAGGLLTHVVSDTALFVVLTVLAWAAWFVFAVCVVLELTAALRGVATPRFPALGVVQLGAARLVAALLLSFVAARPAGASTAALADAAGVPAVRVAAPRLVTGGREVTTTSAAAPSVSTRLAPSTDRGRTGVATPVDTTAGPVLVTVEPGDSAWVLAERYLHDGMRWRELWELNRQRSQADGASWADPELLRPGWQLQLPPDATPGGPSAAATTSGLGSTQAGQGSHLYMVVTGDDLSDIAARELGDAALTDALFDANRGRVQADGDALTDPNLIRPGWLLTLPAPPPAAPPLSSATSATSGPVGRAGVGAPDASIDAADPVAPDPPVASSLPSTTGATASGSASASSPTSVPETLSPPSSTPQRPPLGARPSSGELTRGAAPSPAGDDVLLGASAPFLAGIAGATVFATGLAVWLGRLRRRRAVRGARHLAPRNRRTHRDDVGVDEGVGDTERAVFAAADVPFTRWAAHALAALAGGPPASGAAPSIVELSTEGLEVLWDCPCPYAPAPWEVSDQGWVWRVSFDPEAPLPDGPAHVMLPGLVTIGRRDDRQVLIDLEAFAMLAVVGDAVRVEDFLRAVVFELATGDELSDSYVATVDVACDGTTLGGRVVSTDVSGALARLSAAANAADELLAANTVCSTFAYRTLAVDVPPLETTVVVARVDDGETVDAIRTVVHPGRGVAAVLTGQAAAGGGTEARIVLDADGGAWLEPLGLHFDAVGIPEASGAALVELLAAEAVIPDSGDDDTNVGSAAAGAVAAMSSGDDDELRPVRVDDAADDRGAAFVSTASRSTNALGLDAELFVRVFGVPSVPERPELGRRELQLTVFLACRDRPTTTASVQDALWNGQAMSTKTMWNLVARTRAKLGTFADGRAVFPAADRVQGTLQLASGVLTDLSVLRSCYEMALQVSSVEAIDVLAFGLASVDGPPFDAPGYDWAHHGEQWVADASMLIEQATVLLIELQLAAGNVDGARAAVTRGLRGLPGNEVLYRWRMRVEREAGNLAAVRVAYRELVSFLDDLETEPSLVTCALYEELLGSGSRSRV